MLLLPMPLVLMMWVRSLPLPTISSILDVAAFYLVGTGMAFSTFALAKESGAIYELKRSRYGLILLALGIFSYLVGTNLQSDLLHVTSIVVVYWGTVLYFAGPRSLVSSVPSGLVVLAFLAPISFGEIGLLYVEGVSASALVLSLVLLLQHRNGPAAPGCSECRSSSGGDGFCVSCGRLLGGITTEAPRRGLVAFLVLTLAMVSVLSLTFPVVGATSTPTLVNYGLGGPQSAVTFAPLGGWHQSSRIIQGGGPTVVNYALFNGQSTIGAFVATSLDPQAASNATSAAAGVPQADVSVPASVALYMKGHSLENGGVKYVELEGVFTAGMLNGSSVAETFVAITLTQASSSFQADNGSTLYGAAAAVIGWAHASARWSPALGGLLSGIQFVSATALEGVIGVSVVALFALGRDEELARARRLESMTGLAAYDAAVLDAFKPGGRWTTGQELRQNSGKGESEPPREGFFASLEELSRRGLVMASVFIREGRPKLMWRCLVK